MPRALKPNVARHVCECHSRSRTILYITPTEFLEHLPKIIELDLLELAYAFMAKYIRIFYGFLDDVSNNIAEYEVILTSI